MALVDTRNLLAGDRGRVATTRLKGLIASKLAPQ